MFSIPKTKFDSLTRKRLCVWFTAKDLVMWTDPKKTGAVFGGATLLYYFLEQSGYTAISLVSNVLLLAVIGSFLWSSASRFMGKAMFKIHIPEIDEATTRSLATTFQSAFNKAGAYGNRVLSGSEPVLTLKTAGVLYVASKFGGFFHFWTLCYMVVFSAFVLPKVYVMKKTEIDALVAQGSKQIEAYTAVLKEQATQMMNKAKEEASHCSPFAHHITAHTAPAPAGTDAASDKSDGKKAQ